MAWVVSPRSLYGFEQVPFTYDDRWRYSSRRKALRLKRERRAPVVLCDMGSGLESVSRGLTLWDELRPGLKYMSDDDGLEVKMAADMAERTQRGYVSGTGDSVLSETVAVVKSLVALRRDCESIVAALVVANVKGQLGGISLDDVKELFGESVGVIIQDVIWLNHLPDAVKDWDEEAARLLREYIFAAHQDFRAVVIKLVSVLVEMRRIRMLPKFERHIVALQCMQVFVPLAHSIGMGQIMWELEDLAFREIFPESYIVVEDWHERLWMSNNTLIDSSIAQVREALSQSKRLQQVVSQIDVTGRTKNLFSTFKKILRGNKSKEQILDLVALRIVLTVKQDLDDPHDAQARACRYAYDAVMELWPVEMPERYKDYISNPKPNGYRSIHTTVELPTGQPLEIQIRTDEMHAIAELGTASHGMYKGGVTNPSQVEEFAESVRRVNLGILNTSTSTPLLPMASESSR